MADPYTPSTVETLTGIINMSLSEQRLPRVPLHSLTVQEVINTLRSVAHTTDKQFVFNSEDTLQGNLTKRTGSVRPDSTDEANTMREKVYNACSDEVNFTNILSEVKLWVKGLKSASSDIRNISPTNFEITWNMVYIMKLQLSLTISGI